MTEYHKFDDKMVMAALANAQRQTEMMAGVRQDDGKLSIGAGCITVVVENGQICLELPLGFGRFCLPIPPFIPDGTKVQACIDICTKFGIPTGVKLTVSFNGSTIFTKVFGLC
ncbi:MAG: hypothetical protein AAGF23_08110 [Acidobacteriota bacterium]